MRPILLALATLVTTALCLFVPARADDNDAARVRFHKEMDAVYDYLPYDVTQEIRDSKVAKMDGFWDFVATDLKTYMPLLREALRDPKTNRYFLYDGSGLLIKHSKTPEDLALASDATARCRMKDVGRGYFYFCHHLACEGANDVPAILQLLDDPQFSVFVVKHAMELKQADCVRLCLLVVGEDLWVAPVAKRLSTETNTTAVSTLLRCLVDASTADADAAIRALAENPKTDPEILKLAKSALRRTEPPEPWDRDTKATHAAVTEWLAKADVAGRLPYDQAAASMMRDAAVLVDQSDLAVLRSLRKKTARRISDEAVAEIQSLTNLIRRARAKAK